MSAARASFRTRPATPSDATALCDILNTTIEIGGTTAMETSLTISQFNEYFLAGPTCLSCLVVEATDLGLLGFQALGRHPDLPSDWADIATFSRVEPKTPGVGTALFAMSKMMVGGLGIVAINAAIRADNVGGLAYYEKMGFETYQVLEGIKLRNGRPIDRVLKRYLVKP